MFILFIYFHLSRLNLLKTIAVTHGLFSYIFSGNGKTDRTSHHMQYLHKTSRGAVLQKEPLFQAFSHAAHFRNADHVIFSRH